MKINTQAIEEILILPAEQVDEQEFEQTVQLVNEFFKTDPLALLEGYNEPAVEAIVRKEGLFLKTIHNSDNSNESKYALTNLIQELILQAILANVMD